MIEHLRLRTPITGPLMGLAILTMAGCATMQEAPPPQQTAIPVQTEAISPVVYTMTNHNLLHLFPNAADPTMPSYYKTQPNFPQTLSDSIKSYTELSLKNDGIAGNVSVSVNPTNTSATVTITTQDPSALRYGVIMPQFMNDQYGGLGWNQYQACKQDTQNCWHASEPTPPWSFVLPLSLPIANQKTVMFLNYPPSDSLCTSDYVNNFTMRRWNKVQSVVGITNTILFDTTVDAHPIAAPGSGQSTQIAKTTPYFTGHDQSMLSLLLPPASSTTTAPLVVSGSDATGVWSKIVGKKVSPGMVDNFQLPGVKQTTPWIATNHPTVTTYQCCPGDTSSGCQFMGKPSDQLVQDEVMDLVAACTTKTLADSPATTIQDAQTACQKIWCVDGTSCSMTNLPQICVQARFDYNFGSNIKGNCKCQAAAEAFCKANGNNTCQTPIASCDSYNKSLCSAAENSLKSIYSTPSPSCVNPSSTAKSKATKTASKK